MTYKNHEGYPDPTQGEAVNRVRKEEKQKFKEENERKKEYLSSYRKAVKRERDILEEIQRLRLDKMFPSVVNDGMPHGSSQSDLSDYIAILDEQIELLKKERLEKAKCYKQIEDRIRHMKNENEQEVLRKHYEKGMKWKEIADEMGYDERQIHRFHASALRNFKMSVNVSIDL
ncbi:hypothetical protein [Blautia obeum]|jgi:DNA-directed RNA polymerase specialized sigma subunit|uniref:hypothetical protein n=1 Tax=Blautia obeum TaxID=40520 RepID=UPI001D07264E|nr:hypothetical protein [Blautia obeum]MCB7343364.1 hypothetical protein [Blautia obeum]DAW11743.1 MAG TPA: Protein of unknown function (DUF722) [Caudoviricetes sp.]